MSENQKSGLPALPSLERLQAGEQEAQHALWSGQWDRIYGICARVLGHGPNASDIATDVLSDFLFKYVHNLTEERAIRSYLRLMATRRSLRRRKGQRRHSQFQGEVMADESQRGQDLKASDAVLMPKLADCLSELTPKAQQVIKLRYGGEMTNEKIGAVVGGSKQYIGKLLRQSTERLRLCIERKRAA